MNNIVIGGVNPQTPTEMPAAPTTGTYNAPTSQFNTNMPDPASTAFKSPDMTPNSAATGYNPTVSGGLSFQQNNANMAGAGVNLTGTRTSLDPSQSYISDDALVEKRLTDLLSEDNPYVKLNEMRAKQAQNAKGLSNSSMAITAGNQAAIAAGLDIVKPDAATYAQADLQRQSSDYQGGLSQQQAAQQGALAQQQGDITGRLTDQNKGYEWDTRVQQGAISGDLKTQDAAIQADNLRLQGLSQGALAEHQGNVAAAGRTQEAFYQQQQAEFDGQIQAALQKLTADNANSMEVFKATTGVMGQKLELEQNRIIQEASLNKAQRDSFAGFLTTLQKDYEVSIQNILLDPNLTAASKNKAIQDITYIFNQDIAQMGNVFGVTTTGNTTGTAGTGVEKPA